jgi:hypothetical protein
VIRNIWAAIETDTQGVYRSEVLGNYRQVLDIAREFGLDVDFRFHTHFQEVATWSVPAYVKDPYTNKRLQIAVIRSSEMKNAYFNMVRYVVNGLKDHPAIKRWQIITEPMYCAVTPLYSEDKQRFTTFLTELAQLFRSLDSRPIAIDWGQGDNPFITTPYHNFEPQTLDLSDFGLFNVYLDPYDPSASYLGATWDTVKQAVNYYKSKGKQFWIGEFGWDIGGDEAIRNIYRGYISKFSELGVDGCLAWCWQSLSPNETPWNLCADENGTPKPAFWELYLASQVEKTAMFSVGYLVSFATLYYALTTTHDLAKMVKEHE